MTIFMALFFPIPVGELDVTPTQARARSHVLANDRSPTLYFLLSWLGVVCGQSAIRTLDELPEREPS